MTVGAIALIGAAVLNILHFRKAAATVVAMLPGEGAAGEDAAGRGGRKAGWKMTPLALHCCEDSRCFATKAH